MESLKKMIDKNINENNTINDNISNNLEIDRKHVISIHDYDIINFIEKNNLYDKHVIYKCNLDIMLIDFVTTDNTILVLKVINNNLSDKENKNEINDININSENDDNK